MELHSTGISAKAVGKQIGRSECTVLNFLKKNNIQRNGHPDVYSNEVKEIIKNLHADGYNTVQISEKTGKSQTGIERYLKRNGLYRKPEYDKIITKEDEDKIREMYLSGMTSKEIYEHFKYKVSCEETIQYRVRKLGIARPATARNIVNHDYFENIDTPAKAYFLGFLMADGNIYQDQRGNRSATVQMSLQAKDLHILETLKAEWESDNKIAHRKDADEYSISIRSNKMAYDLEKHGVVPRKTFLLRTLPEIPVEFYPDLIRGIFDGDGTVYTLKKDGRLKFGFYGTYELVFDIVKLLVCELGFPDNKITNKGTVSFITFCRKQDIINFYNYIYYDQNVICLKRKKEKFDSYLPKIINKTI